MNSTRSNVIPVEPLEVLSFAIANRNLTLYPFSSLSIAERVHAARAIEFAT